MKARYILCGILMLGLFSMAISDVQAGDKKRRGTAGATYLLVPTTARMTSLGNGLTSGLSTLNGIEALSLNPAGLALNTGTSALFSRVNYVADIGINHFGVAQRFGNNNLALTVTSWDFGEIPLQTEADPEISSLTWTASTVVVGVTYAREFTDRISAGVTTKLLSERIDDVSASGIAFDAGMTYVAGESGFRFGVSLKNFGPSMKYAGVGLTRQAKLPEQPPHANQQAVSIEAAQFELPSMLNFGVSYTREFGAGAIVTLIGNFRSNSFSQDQYSGAIELSYQNLFYVRGGYQWEPDMDLTFFTGPSFGAGLNMELVGAKLSVDYAYRATDFFKAVNMVTASITL